MASRFTNWTLVAAPQAGTAHFKTYKMPPPDLVPAGGSPRLSLTNDCTALASPRTLRCGCAGDKSGGASRDGTKVIARRALHFETARDPRRLIDTAPRRQRVRDVHRLSASSSARPTPPAHHHRLHPGAGPSASTSTSTCTQATRRRLLRVHECAHLRRVLLRPLASPTNLLWRERPHLGDRTPSQ